jgi:subtilase family protein
MFRKSLLAGAAMAGLLTATSAPADTLLNLTLIDGGPSNSTTSNAVVSPFYGNINPFYGNINPFYGNINPFYGNISPFWGNIQPFWGNIDPFYGTIDPFYGNIDAFWGNIQPFTTNPFWSSTEGYWQNAGPQWGAINTSWANLQSSGATDYSGLQAQLQSFLSQAKSFWDPAVQKYTGQGFDSFAGAMMAKYGIDPNDPNSLANTDVVTRSAFLLNFYDGLMSFTGVDHVDWWMPQVNWSPSLTQMVGTNKSVVGLLDTTTTAAAADAASVTFVGGYNLYVNGHGTATASLIAAKQDGTNVMGVAPNATILLDNPFDATGTASWTDVANGIANLYNSGAHVVNASLGVPGWTLSKEWVNILTGTLLSNRSNDLVIVKAAGNEGVSQTANLAWLGLAAPQNLLVVGSVGPTGQISSFSNTPGSACFTVLGVCLESNKLMYRYLVAPGELMLVSDGNGGVTRMSGTSFAAPLVTGAVALLQERWPWLQQHAAETTQIILQSATDLGAPGVDPVYGWGELNIQASQSPLNFNNLVVYQPYTYGGGTNVNTPLLNFYSSQQLKSAALNPGQLNLWQQKGAYLVAFESIGTTYRDFNIPLSSMLVGKSQTVNGSTNPFQAYLYQRLIDWAHGVKSLDYTSQTTPLAAGDWQLAMTTTEATPDEQRAGEGPIHAEFAVSNRETGMELKLGEGAGAFALTGSDGFALRSDFDPQTGGVNPVLGFASGGFYASGGYMLAPGLKLNVGVSEKTDDHRYMDPTFGPLQTSDLPTDHAQAAVMGLDYKLSERVSLNASYTRLNEADGLLGAQGSGPLSLGSGTNTQGTTVGATARLGNGWTMSGSATVASTDVGNADGMLSFDRRVLQSTAFELMAGKTGVFEDADTVRLSLAQPLHIEAGALSYSSIQVVDRDTGALGPLNETWNIAGAREYRMEALYSVPVLDGKGEVAGFGLVDVNPPTEAERTVSLSFGGEFKVNF